MTASNDNRDASDGRFTWNGVDYADLDNREPFLYDVVLTDDDKRQIRDKIIERHGVTEKHPMFERYFKSEEMAARTAMIDECRAERNRRMIEIVEQRKKDAEAERERRMKKAVSDYEAGKKSEDGRAKTYKEEIMGIKDRDERLNAIAANMGLFYTNV